MTKRWEEHDLLVGLTIVQREVIAWTIEGLHVTEIADRRHCSEKAIRDHLRAAARHLGIPRATQREILAEFVRRLAA